MKLLSGKRSGIKLLVILLSFLGISSVFAASGDVDANFNASIYGNVNGPVTIVKKLPDGKFLLGGLFLDINGFAASGVARLNADLTVDTSFKPVDFFGGYGAGGVVYALGVQSDGKIIVGGDVYGSDNIFSPGLKRLFPNGALDNSFQPPQVATSFIYYDIEILADDKILAGGQRLNPDGTVDNSFTTITDAKKMEVQPDGKILVATSGTGAFRRYNSNGTLDGTFAAVTTDGVINAITYLPDGKSLIGGAFSTINGVQQGKIARINSDGTLDSTFNQNMSGFNGAVSKIIVRADGKLSVGGSFGTYNGVFCPRLILLNSNGSRDTSFQSELPITGYFIYDFEVMPNGKIIAGFDANISPNTVYIFNSNGTFDNSKRVVATISATVNDIIQQPDGKILIAGSFLYANGQPRRSIVRLNTDGSLDTSFIPYPESNINGLALQPDGKILVALGPAPCIDRLNPDGSRDMSFQQPYLSQNHIIREIALEADGRFLVTGYVFGERLTRFNANGSSTASGGASFDGIVHKIIVLPDGKILVGGAFTQGNPAFRGGIMRLNPIGTPDNTFNPSGANGVVYDMDVQADGKIIISGDFTAVNGSQNQNHVARLNPDGTLDTSFTQSLPVNAPIFGVKVQPDGKIIAGGNFNQIGSTTKLALARFNTNGTLDSNFNPYVNITIPRVSKIYLQTDGKILVGGQFTKMNGVSHVRIARLLNDSAPTRKLFDYDGDGKADVSVFRPSENKWYILQSSNSAVVQRVFGLAGDIPAPADYDGDGITDPAIFRPSSGDWWYLSSINGAQISVHWGASGDIPRPGDFDGDGKTDFVVYRPSTNVWYRLGSTGVTSTQQFGIAEDKPLTGDFDGDGKNDIAVYRPSTGTWWYAASASSGQFRAVQWGVSTDTPAPADYDGDGKTDFAVYRASTGVWYVMNSSNSTQTILQFGVSEDKPVAADYDGDGKADIAVFRPSSGIWYLLRTTAGFGAVQWGISTDIPTENAFVP